MENLLITVSGGRSSAMMARHIQTNEKYNKYNKVYVFCNTGMERPETINFLKNIVKFWNIDLKIIEGLYSNNLGTGVGYKLVDFDTMNMDAKETLDYFKDELEMDDESAEKRVEDEFGKSPERDKKSPYKNEKGFVGRPILKEKEIGEDVIMDKNKDDDTEKRKIKDP